MERTETHPGNQDGCDQQRADRTIVVIADGWKKSNFVDALSAGDLPEISQHIIAHGGVLPNIIGNVPSVSIASHTSLLTSEYQETHQIPGHRWVAGADRSCHDYLGLRGPIAANADISSRVKTIFESAPANMQTISVQNIITRGAGISTHVPSLRSGPILGRLGDLVLEFPNSVTVGWLPRGDSLSHVHGPESPLVRADMIETSRAIGKLATRLSNAGLWESTQFLMVPDHGHRSVTRRTDIGEALLRAGVRSSVNSRRSGPESVVMTSGDSSAYVYLHPRYTSSVLEVADAIAAQEGIGLVCVRVSGLEARFFSSAGASSAVLAGDWLLYSVESGNDPLGITASSESVTIPFLEVSAMGVYPDFLHQYFRSHVDGRSSPVLVFADEDTHFGQGPRIGWRFGFHRGTHGGPFADEVVVAGVYRGPGLIDLNEPIRSADILRSLGMMDPGPRVAQESALR